MAWQISKITVTLTTVGVLAIGSLIWFHKRKHNNKKKLNLAYQLPIVNMEDSNAAEVLYNAMTEYGFFYLENHGIDQTLLDEVFHQSQKFFALSMEEKKKVQAGKLNRGYTVLGDEILDPDNQVIGDSKEGYYIGREVPDDSIECEFPLCGPNTWPEENILPNWRSTMDEYFSEMSDLGFNLCRLIGKSLDLPDGFFDPEFERPMAVLRLLHYTSQLSDPERGILAAGAHSDYGMITLLATDDQPGLQIYLKDQWLDVPPMKGFFIVNLGDMLQRWTNDHVKSTIHRVVNITGNERYSVPFFYEPNYDCQVVCLPQFCSLQNPAKYNPITSGQHLLEKLDGTHEQRK